MTDRPTDREIEAESRREAAVNLVAYALILAAIYVVYLILKI